jgi:hypothetical protein
MRTLHLPQRVNQHRIDFLGAALLTPPWSRCCWSPRRAGTGAGRPASRSGLLALSAASLVGFVAVERRMGPEAILPLRMFSSSIFSLTTATALLVGAGMFGGMVVLPLYLQIVKGSSPTQAGLQLIPLMVGIIVTSGSQGR